MTEHSLTDRSAALSERGRRRVNQDAVLVAELGDGAELVAVADGMGGHSAGEIASRRALEALRAALEDGHELVAAVRAANVAIYNEASATPDHAGMGTTLVALLRKGGSYTVANVGDSRAYRLDSAGIRQLTEDHSFVADAVRSGQLSAEDAEKSRWRNAVTRALGTDPDVQVDCFGPFDARASHLVLLCTDGLHRVLDDDVMRSTALRSAPDAAARELVTAAFEAGSDDNISVALVRFGPRPQSTVPSAAAPDPGRRRRHRHSNFPTRWTMIQSSIIFLAFIAVLIFVALLSQVL